MARDKRRNPVNVQQVSAARQDGQPLERTLLAPVETEISDLTGRVLTAGAGMTGGGDLSANRTFDVGAGTGIIVGASTVAADFGSGAGKVTEGNDARLSNARVPTAHAVSHAAGGTDVVTLTEAQITGLVADLAAKIVGPAAATDEAIARYDGVTGKLTQNSPTTLNDTGDILLPAAAVLRMAAQNRTRYLNSGANAYVATAQTLLPSNTFSVFTFDAEHFDTDAIHDNVTNNSRLTCKLAGKYLISATMAPTGAALTGALAFYIAIRLNGTTYEAIGVGAPDTAKNSGACVETILSLAVGDYVEALGNYTATSGTYNTQATDFCSFSMMYQGE